MSIWAHTLVKNDGRWLWFAVCSVINYVDKILIWDAGSSDSSVLIIQKLIKKYPTKIEYKKRVQTDINDFTTIRQEMLMATRSDWVLMLDADEIWWKDSIEKVIQTITTKTSKSEIESVIVPTVNTVGDMFHYQNKNAGRYKFGERVGHYNLRVFNRNIPGLRSQGVHGVWGWADGTGKMIQDRDPGKIVFIDAPYIHTTFLKRSDSLSGDSQVVKRSKKLKYEIGVNFSLDFYYPEVFFENRPKIIDSPWMGMSNKFKIRALFETPLRKIKRSLIKNQIGY